MIHLVPTPKISSINDERYHSIAPSIYSQTEKWHKYINSFSEIFSKYLRTSRNCDESGTFDEKDVRTT